MEKIGRTKLLICWSARYWRYGQCERMGRTRRGSKQVNFIALNDGSTINNLQIVVDLANFDEEMLKLMITTGACISVNGEMVESVGSGQKGGSTGSWNRSAGYDNTYPLQKKGHSMEFCARLLICVRVPIHSVQCSASVTTWRLLFTSSSMKRASSISIRRSLRLPIVKVPDRCSRWLPWTCMTWRKTRGFYLMMMISSASRQVWLFPVSWKVSWLLLLWELSTHSVPRSVPKTPTLPPLGRVLDDWAGSGFQRHCRQHGLGRRVHQILCEMGVG